MADVYKRALVQRNLMFGWFLCFFPALILGEQIGIGEETSFAIYAVLGSVLVFRTFTFKCPHCGSNLFIRKGLVFPWPNKTCSHCGADLDAS